MLTLPCPAQFVNFKLYHQLGLRYPPVLDPKLEQVGGGEGGAAGAGRQLAACLAQGWVAGEAAESTALQQIALLVHLGSRLTWPLPTPPLQAAAGLEALMKDLAGSGDAAAAAPRQLTAAAGQGQDEGDVNPAAQQRLGSLADKVRQLG